MKNNYPTINLKYSSIYDRQWAVALEKKYNSDKAYSKYKTFIKNLKQSWTPKNEKQILQLISKYSGLKWQKTDINIYFVNNLNVSGFSDPLTIKITTDYLGICETLIHEMVHVILSQHKEVRNIQNKLKKIYKNEDDVTILHIIVNAIARRVFIDMYGEKQYQKVYARVSKYARLKCAYQILETLYPKLGKNILESLNKLK